MFKRKPSILELAQSIETRSAEQAIARSRRLAELAIQEANQQEYVQEVIDSVGKAFFIQKFARKPNVVGRAEFAISGGTITSPVFGIEYANISHYPGWRIEEAIRVGKKWDKDFEFNKLPYLSAMDRQERRNAKKHSRAVRAFDNIPNVQPEFRAVCACSGCGQWAELAEASRRWHALTLAKPLIENIESIAANKNLFELAASGLALDCGSFDALGGYPTNSGDASPVILCNNMLAKLQFVGHAYIRSGIPHKLALRLDEC